jgi:hypothetical protein
MATVGEVCEMLTLQMDLVLMVVAVEKMWWRLALMRSSRRDWRDHRRHSVAQSLAVERVG